MNIIVFRLLPNTKFPEGASGGEVRLFKTLESLDQKIKVHLFGNQDLHSQLIIHHISHIWHRYPFRSLIYHTKIDLTFKSIYCIFAVILNQNFISDVKNVLADNNTSIYTTSDLFWETIPAFYLKIRFPVIKWIQVVHHIYPPWYQRPGNKIINFVGYFLQRFSLKLIKSKADKIIAVNSHTIKFFTDKGFSRRKILLSSNGIDLKNIEKNPPNKTIYSGSFLGRLNYSKGVFDLLKIWYQVNLKIPQATLNIIGEGPIDIKNKLNQEVLSFGLKKTVKFRGFLPTNQVYSTLKESGLFIFPSHEEGWGIAIAEAMACGLAVVCWDLPVYRSVFGDHPIYIKPFDLNSFSQQVIYLLEHPQITAKMGRLNRQFIKKYDWEKVAQKEYRFMIKDD